MVSAGLDLPEIAARVNNLHYAEGPEARRKYVTAIMARLDAERNELSVLNAGHNPAFLLSPAGARLIEASGLPLGLLPGIRYEAEAHSVAGSCGLLLYTEGLTEGFRGEEEFGSERLLAEFQQLQASRCIEVLERLWEVLNGFSGSTIQRDDMTALALLKRPEVLG